MQEAHRPKFTGIRRQSVCHNDQKTAAADPTETALSPVVQIRDFDVPSRRVSAGRAARKAAAAACCSGCRGKRLL